MNKKLFSAAMMMFFATAQIGENVSAINSLGILDEEAREAAVLASFDSFAVSAFCDSDFDSNGFSLSDDFITCVGVDGNDYWCYEVELNNEYYGYAIFGLVPNTNNVRLMEFNHSFSPYALARNKYGIENPCIIYAGPFATYLSEDAGNARAQSNAINFYTGEYTKVPDITSYGEWYELDDVSIALAAYTPPSSISSYHKISFYDSPVFGYDIQSSLSGIRELYGCGPAAGANLLYSLATRNSDYEELLYWNAVDLGNILVTEMHALAGTTFEEFLDGISNFLSDYNLYPDLEGELYSEGTYLGDPTTGSTSVVWNNLLFGISDDKPVAVLAGYSTETGNDNYPDSGDTRNMEYHWFTALGYCIERVDTASNLYIYGSSWGDEVYVNYSALTYWRDTLGTVYVDENYD